MRRGLDAGLTGIDPPLSGGAATAETHTAILFFVGDRVYKLKKPGSFGFLDFATLEARSADRPVGDRP